MSDDSTQVKSPSDSDRSIDKRGLLTVAAIFGGLFVVLLIFAVVMITAFGDADGIGGADNQVGVVEISGPITGSKKVVEDLRAFSRRDSIGGIVVRIDSPGGAVAPSQEISEAVKRAGARKPVVVSMGSTAASGGYYIAVGAEHIIANPGTVTGSIGVISQVFNVQKLLDDIDVEVHTMKTGTYKDSGSMFRKFTSQDRAYFDALLQDIYKQFVEDVAQARGLEVSRVRQLADGRVYTGRQAKEYGLVDRLGSLHDAVQWVKSEADIDGQAHLVYPPKDKLGLVSSLVRGITDTAVREVKSQQTPLFEYRMAR